MIGSGLNRLRCPIVDVASCISDYTAKDLIVIMYLVGNDYI